MAEGWVHARFYRRFSRPRLNEMLTLQASIDAALVLLTTAMSEYPQRERA